MTELSQEQLADIEEFWASATIPPAESLLAMTAATKAAVAELRELRTKHTELVRCATGVIRTAHPDKIADAVVMAWWQALERAVLNE